MGPAVKKVAGDCCWCTIIIFVWGRGGGSEKGFSWKKYMKGREFVKNLFAGDGDRHRKLLKCLGVHTFSKMTVEKPVLSASYWGLTIIRFTVDGYEYDI